MTLGAAARVVITPPPGGGRRATGVHQDRYARAIGLQVAGRALAVVSCDSIGVRTATVAGARRLIERDCGLDASSESLRANPASPIWVGPAGTLRKHLALDRVLINATHNHSSPLTGELRASGLAGKNDELWEGKSPAD